MYKHRLLWPPWSDELVCAEEVAIGRRSVGRSSEQLTLPISVDRNGVIKKLDHYGATVGLSAEEGHSSSLGPS